MSKPRAPPAIRQAWERREFRARLMSVLPFPVFLQNDATAACGAELVFGTSDANLQDFLYLYVDTFIGGGVVTNRTVVSGRSGNAGAMGSMLVPDTDGRLCQLIDVVSLIQLDRARSAQGSGRHGRVACRCARGRQLATR